MYCSKNIILDFDGTIYRLFSNYDLQPLVNKIYELLKLYDIPFTKKNDAFDAFGIIMHSNVPNSLKNSLLEQIQEWFVEDELNAIGTGIQVDGFFEFVQLIKEKNITIAIVSNNSQVCIEEYFKQVKLDVEIPIIGRVGIHPERMKPATHMLEEMCKTLDCSNEDIIYVGDHYRDYECAKKFGCQFIGITPTLKKRKRFTEYNPNITLVNDFYELSKMLFSE